MQRIVDFWLQQDACIKSWRLLQADLQLMAQNAGTPEGNDILLTLQPRLQKCIALTKETLVGSQMILSCDGHPCNGSTPHIVEAHQWHCSPALFIV